MSILEKKKITIIQTSNEWKELENNSKLVKKKFHLCTIWQINYLEKEKSEPKKKTSLINETSRKK